MIEAQVPEMADGGYWYVVPAVEIRANHYKPATAPPEWVGVFDGEGAFLVRSLQAWLNPHAETASSADIISAAFMEGRVGEWKRPALRNASEL